MKPRHCCNLTTTPDFLEITNILDLKGCVNLVTIHPSIGMLKRLVVLNMRDYKRAMSCLNVNQVPEGFGLNVGLQSLVSYGTNNIPKDQFHCLPRSLSQLSHLHGLVVDGCKKLEVLPKLQPSVWTLIASDCTSLRELLGSSKEPFTNSPQCLDSSITSQGSIHQFSTFLGLLGFGMNIAFKYLDIVYHGNGMPEWFTNRSRENHVKVELPSNWSYDENFRRHGFCVVFKCKKPHKLEGYSVKNFRGYATYVVFKCKKPFMKLKGYSVKNFDGGSIEEHYCLGDLKEFLKREVIGTQDSYMIWLHYTNFTWVWKEENNFVTFSFFEENNEDYEVKECGVRLICDEDIQERNLSMLQDLRTLSQHGGMLLISGYFGPSLEWSW
ncbi:NB-ARC domains-containing protein [Tanacetum coccineum]